MERAEKKNDRFEHKTEQDPTFVYGKNAVTELLKSGAAVDTVFVQDTMNAAQAGYYTAIAREAGAVVKRVHAAKLRGMCGTEGHQGVAAWAASVDYVSLDDLLAEAARRGEPPFLLLADGVEDPHNLGAIIRTALLCGAHGVVIPRRGGVPVTPTVLKSSAGAAARLPVARVANIGEAVRRLKAQRQSSTISSSRCRRSVRTRPRQSVRYRVRMRTWTPFYPNWASGPEKSALR